MAKPLLKFAGRKDWLVPELQTRGLTEGEGFLIEPFAGSAAVTLALAPERGYLCDKSRDLFALHKMVKENAMLVDRALMGLINLGMDRESYLSVRAMEPGGDLMVRAARVLYLNRLGFNGLWRTNKSGQNNVPYGNYNLKKLAWPGRRMFLAAQKSLAGMTVLHQPWEETLDLAERGDFVYADPPYMGTYDGYTGTRFEYEDQERLASRLRELNEKGVRVACSNSNDPRVKELYEWAQVDLIPRNRSIAQQGDDRGLAFEVLAWAL